jgi:hypothetical protein
MSLPPPPKKKQRQKQLGADKLFNKQRWKLKNLLMSLFSDVFSFLVHFEFFAIFTRKGSEECIREETAHSVI